MDVSWPYPRLVGHRGGGRLAPENTLAGLRAAAASGYGGVEFDVMLSADATPVLIHDDTVDRTTDGDGAVSRLTDAELARLDAGAWHGAQFRSERIPTLREAAQTCLALGLWPNIEIKPATGHEATTGAAVAGLAARLWQDAPYPPVLSSFSRDALQAARRAAPGLPRGLLCEALPHDWLDALRLLDCRSLHCDHRHLDAALIASAREARIALVCYTVNDRERAASLLRAGVGAVITDRLDLIPADLAR